MYHMMIYQEDNQKGVEYFTDYHKRHLFAMLKKGRIYQSFVDKSLVILSFLSLGRFHMVSYTIIKIAN